MRGRDDDPAAGQIFAHVVVGFAKEPDGDAMSEEGAEALAACAAGVDVDGVVREPHVAVTLGDSAGGHGPHGAVGVLDLQIYPRLWRHRARVWVFCGTGISLSRLLDQLAIDVLVQDAVDERLIR